LQNLRINDLARQVATLKEAIKLMMRVIDPEELKAAVELRTATPSRAEFVAMVAESGRPTAFRDDDEVRPW
jgi:hypothetical protein